MKAGEEGEMGKPLHAMDLNHVQLETWTFPICRIFLALIPQPLLPKGEGESDSKSLSPRERDLG